MNKLILFIVIIIFTSPLIINNSALACETCVNINNFNKPKDRYYIKLINHRVKNIKKDLKIIKLEFENINKINSLTRPLLKSNPKINIDYFLNIYLNDYSMPLVRAKKASSFVYNFLDNNSSNLIEEWRSGYYKGYALPLNSYFNDKNEYCRVYAEAILKNYHYNIFKKTACIDSDGNWQDVEKITVIKDKFKKIKDKKEL